MSNTVSPDWGYRCNPAGTDLAQTHELLLGGFCWRTAFNSKCALIANVKAVRVQDTIAVFYSLNNTDVYLGTYEVLPPRLAAAAAAPALDRVTETKLEDILVSAQYKTDPCLNAFVGFRIKPYLYITEPSPPTWPGRNSLVRMRGRASYG